MNERKAINILHLKLVVNLHLIVLGCLGDKRLLSVEVSWLISLSVWFKQPAEGAGKNRIASWWKFDM